MKPEQFDSIIAEVAAQQQVLIMALRRIATLTRQMNEDPAEFAAHWKKMGALAIEQIDFSVAPGHLDKVRESAKSRLADIVDIGMREPATTPPPRPKRLVRRPAGTAQ